MMISATILTNNSSKTLRNTLESIDFVDEIVVMDTGSTDNTLSIAEEFHKVKIYHEAFFGFGDLHNKACKVAKNDWILSIDADEIITLDLKKEILNLDFDNQTLYEIPFKNVLFGKKIRFSDWNNNHPVRLFNKTVTSFCDSKVHEKVLKNNMKCYRLKSHAMHDSYRDYHDFLRKLQIYTDLFVEQNAGKQSSFSKAITHAIFAFFKTYFLKLGIFDGKEGLFIANYQAQTAFFKYLKLMEKSMKP